MKEIDIYKMAIQIGGILEVFSLNKINEILSVTVKKVLVKENGRIEIKDCCFDENKKGEELPF